MKKINADSPLIRLKLKKRALLTELNNLKRNLISQVGTERKKRSILKQIKSVETNITEINKSIQNRQNIKSDNISKMIRTPPKKI